MTSKRKEMLSSILFEVARVVEPFFSISILLGLLQLALALRLVCNHLKYGIDDRERAGIFVTISRY